MGRLGARAARSAATGVLRPIGAPWEAAGFPGSISIKEWLGMGSRGVCAEPHIGRTRVPWAFWLPLRASNPLHSALKQGARPHNKCPSASAARRWRRPSPLETASSNGWPARPAPGELRPLGCPAAPRQRLASPANALSGVWVAPRPPRSCAPPLAGPSTRCSPLLHAGPSRARPAGQ